jgi:DNA end-binding protein Ku
MHKATLEELDRDDLHDAYTQDLKGRIEEKQKDGRDLLSAPEEPEQEAAEETNVIDLMQVLKERLQGRQSDESPQRARGRKKAPAGDRAKHPTRDELYEQAKSMDIPGRSKMSKKQLIDAISHN